MKLIIHVLETSTKVLSVDIGETGCESIFVGRSWDCSSNNDVAFLILTINLQIEDWNQGHKQSDW